MDLMESKRLGGHIVETKQEKRNGVPVGIVAGHIAVWEPDKGGVFGFPDRFRPGAFLKSLSDHRQRNNRQIRLKDHHGRTIGGFPIDTAHEDAIGLFAIGEVNLETQLGKEAFSLAKQNVITDFSLGFIAVDDKIEGGFRDIFEAIIIEGSLVDEPLNKRAQITEVKVAIQFQDLPLAERLAAWNPAEAKARIKNFTESRDVPTNDFRNAFIWVNEAKSQSFDSYQLLIADVVDGKLVAIPRAIFKAANEIIAKNITVPDDYAAGVVKHLDRYYAKMGLISPFGKDEKQFFGKKEIKNFTKRDMEKALIDSGAFSRGAAVELSSKFNGLKDPESAADILRELSKIKF